MVFSSPLFLFVFLPAALLLYFLSPGRLKFTTLTLLSYLFYAWSDPRFDLLLLWVTIFDYTVGHLLFRTPNPTRRRLLLILSLANSLTLLFYFKYALLAHNLLYSALGSPAPVLSIVLPAGISFYTFESISYIVDIYRRQTTPARSFISFACYLSQFPHLVAGPIIRYQELAPQLRKPHPSLQHFSRGIIFFSLGLAKKILIADTLSRAVDPAFSGTILSTPDTWFATLAFSFQLYFDFSGYSDMAIGLALMLGFHFPQNFNSPYRSTSISEFWRRWHITLSSWLRDYLYFPLGGSRKSPRRTHLNLLLTMLLAGLWHGASLTFAAWGLYHGALLSLERSLKPRLAARPQGRLLPLKKPLQTLLTFLLISIGWILFRSESLLLALYRLAHLFIPTDFSTPPITRSLMYTPQILLTMLAATLITFLSPTTWTLAQRLTPPRALLALLLLIASLLLLSLNSTTPFLYFRF